MLDRIFGLNTHYRIHVFLLFAIGIGLPTTKVILSLGMVLLLVNVLVDARFKDYWKILKSNNILHYLLLFYFFAILALSWSPDILQGVKELKTKLPFLLIPLLVAMNPIRSKKDLHFILTGFLVAITATSIFNFLSYKHIIGHRIYDDIRGLSLFTSHIRYALLIIIGIAIALYFALIERKQKWWMIIVVIWMAYYTFFSEIVTGYIALSVLLIASVSYFILYWKPRILVPYLILVLLAITSIIYLIMPPKNIVIPREQLGKKTALGNYYLHYDGSYSEINGQAIFHYYSPIEIKTEWDKVSSIPYNITDRNMDPVEVNLMRYMTSLGLRKDAEGFKQLTPQDINNIEVGYTSRQNAKGGFLNRMYGIRHQLMNNVDPNGHSLLQRLEYWKTSIQIIKNNWLIGVGTGGNQLAFDNAYELNHSKLRPENRHRSHNQFLAFFISSGIIGFLFLIFIAFAIIKDSLVIPNYIYLVTASILFISFLNEDTLETQVGVTIFAFFISIGMQYKQLSQQTK